jgi:hypothetical protein
MGVWRGVLGHQPCKGRVGVREKCFVVLVTNRVNLNAYCDQLLCAERISSCSAMDAVMSRIPNGHCMFEM